MWGLFKKKKDQSPSADSRQSFQPAAEFSQGYEPSLKAFREKLEGCADLIERPFSLKSGEKATLFYFEGLINQDLLQRDLLPVLFASTAKSLSEPYSFIPLAKIKKESRVQAAIHLLFSGFAVLIAESQPHALAFELQGWEKRSIEEPEVERNIRGPHEGFTENIRTNTSILRKTLRTPQLKFKEYTLGRRSRTTVAVAYIEGIANPELLLRLEERIRKIDYDAVLSSGYIEQLTIENPYSPFPQYQVTERPDKTIANLLEGRLAVMIDGTPEVIIAPVTFFQFFQAMDDYSANWITASVIRFARIAAVFLAIFTSSFYIAVLTFHYESIPLKMLLQLAEARAKVPFPPVIEAFLLESIIELLREAAIRLPSFIGQVVGVVGGIVIGQAVVSAGLVGNVMIIVVSVSALASFIVPNYDMGLAIRFVRFPIMIISAVFGIIGLLIGGAVLLAHLLSLESLGQPYFAPLAPLHAKNLKDTFIRAPLAAQGPRPESVLPADRFRGKGRKRG